MNDEKIFEEVWEIARVIRNETRPVDGHTDPKAIIDCWNELEDRIKEAIRLARQDERRRVIRIIEKEKREIEGWIKVCTFEELEKTGDIFSVLEMILKKIKSGENSTGTALAKTRKECGKK